MKKLGLILAILLIIATGAWFYLANQFEKIVEDDLLPKIQENSSVIKADLDTVIIEKFKFKATFKNVTFLPESPEFKLKSDLVETFYNPFTDQITLCLNDEKLSIGTDNLAIYIVSPKQSISFNRSVLLDNASDIDATIMSKTPSLYFVDGDKFIGRAGDSKFNILSAQDDESYMIDFKFDASKLEINPDSKYIKNLLQAFADKSSQTKVNLKDTLYDINDYYKIFEATGPMDYSTEYSIKLNKKMLESVQSAIQTEMKFEDLLKQFSLDNNNSFLSIKEKVTNSAIQNSAYIYFSNENSKFKVNIATELESNYTDTQKQEVTSILGDMLYKIMQESATKSNMKLKNTLDEFTPMATSIADIKHMHMNIDASYDVATNNSTHSVKIGLNDFNAELDGAINNRIYDAKAIINTPQMLISGVTGFYETSMKHLVEKNKVPETANDIDAFNKMVTHIKNNGLEVMAVLHNGEELKESDILKSNIHFDNDENDLKINDKTLLEILTDKRVAKFFQSAFQSEDNQGGQE